MRRSLLALVLVPLLVTPASAEKRFAAANGVDTPSCGTQAAPCRSIGRSIQNAAIGDTIEVGPGRYGDLDGNGIFGGTGEEIADVDSGCDCMIRVDRPLMLISRDGAGATVLDAGGAPIDVVAIAADRVTFGLKGKGFTLTGSSDGNGLDCSQNDIKVAGNRAFKNGNIGFRVDGSAGVVVVEGNVAESNGDNGFRTDDYDLTIVRRNIAVANGSFGFSIGGGGAGVSATVTDNLAVGNSRIGFSLPARTTLKGNAAIANGEEGFDVSDDSIVTGNVAQGNGRGIELDDRNVVTKNSVVGNRGFGIVVGGAGNVVTKNSIFGNDDAGDTTDPLPAPLVLNCGIQNLVMELDASQNFWGAAAGPGADPADAFCQFGAVADGPVAPVATKEIKVKPKAAK
jgi:parallel beta-helix repeat protein